MTFRQRAAVALARFVIRWSGVGGTGSVTRTDSLFHRLLGTLPGSQLNVAKEVGDPYLNSAVAICCNWIADQFAEPTLEVVKRGADKAWEAYASHRLTALVEDPNPFYDGDALWASTAVSYGIAGEAFWLKERGMAGMGLPVRLWYLPHWQVFPRWPADGSQFISHYEYRVNGETFRLELDQVVHFFDKIDVRTRRGISRLYPALRSVGALNEADTMVYALLKNMGIPGVLLSPKDSNVDLDTPARDTLETLWNEFTGDGRGRPLIPSAAVEATPLAFSPEQLMLDKAITIPQDYVCSSLRVPAMVVGLTAGAQAKTYANYGEARRAAYEDCVSPLQTRLARILTRRLGPDFGLSRNERCRWNYDNVPAMQEDRQVAAKCAREDYKAGVAMRSEARVARGYPAVPGRDEVFCELVKVKPASGKGGSDGADAADGEDDEE